jgi:predicted RNase H-like HicB family nuclease
MSSFETLEQGALTHGIDPEELLKNLKEDFEEG